MTNEKTFVTKTEVRLSKEKSAEEIEGIGFDFLDQTISGEIDPVNLTIFEIRRNKPKPHKSYSCPRKGSSS